MTIATAPGRAATALLRAIAATAALAALIGLTSARAGEAPAAERAADDAYYPVTVTDLAGREVTLKAPPERIVLQDSNDLLALSILEPGSPVARVVGWQNTLEGSDPGLWEVIAERWPQAEAVDALTFNSSGQVDVEGILNLAPDLVVARLPARTAIEEGQLGRMLETLDIPLLYVDTEYDPLENVPKSLEILGEALNRRAPAETYSREYRGRLEAIRERVAPLPGRRVFVEVRAGEAGDECCKTHGSAAWGHMIEAVGATNAANAYLDGLPSGTISLEALISQPPDHYLMTGTQRVNQGNRSIPLGYRAEEAAIEEKMAQLMARPGFNALTAGDLGCVQALHHQFYNNIFNLVALEYLALALWPAAFDDLDPSESYRELIARYTELPVDVPFTFSAEYCTQSDT